MTIVPPGRGFFSPYARVSAPEPKKRRSRKPPSGLRGSFSKHFVKQGYLTLASTQFDVLRSESSLVGDGDFVLVLMAMVSTPVALFQE